MNPVFPYSGGKRRLLKYILPVIPEHSTYIEPFAGGLAVFLQNACNPAKSPIFIDSNDTPPPRKTPAGVPLRGVGLLEIAT